MLALQGRQIDVSGMVAKGYGEAVPLADNATDAGREANRRIEFTLIGGSKPDPAPADVLAEEPAADGIAAAAPVREDAAPEGAAPDFSNDTSPSLAPKDMTRRPKKRPAQNG